MLDFVERLVRCGVNLADAYDICDDYLYDCDYEGLDAYVRAVERDYRKGKKNVG